MSELKFKVIIGKSLNKDTSTISKAFRKAEDLLTFDEHFLKNYEKIETELRKAEKLTN